MSGDVVFRKDGDIWKGFINDEPIADVTKSREWIDGRHRPVYSMLLRGRDRYIKFRSLKSARLHLRRIAMEEGA